jgi:hypothetical protein
VGWVTLAVLAFGGTPVVLWQFHPRTADSRVLIVVWVLFSCLAGGWSARMLYRDAPEPRSWSIAAPCVVIGALCGVLAFLLLGAIALAVVAIALAHSGLTW